MWLIHTKTLELVSRQECPRGEFVILSHTWGTDAEELTFDEFKVGNGRQKCGFQKIEKCCDQAWQDGVSYAWVDTCCIDKGSSSELSEAVNSMFEWYAKAKLCYVHLVDVSETGRRKQGEPPPGFAQSKWFTRGWTLQELIAPHNVSFYDRDWTHIGNKTEFIDPLELVTGIEKDVLLGQKSFLDCSIAQRMSWASKRETTRLEDRAYSLLGLFNVSIPLLYGEGSKAFLRLQRELIRQTDDETIFAWTEVAQEGSGLLAPGPENFVNAADIQRYTDGMERPPYQETNRGLSIECRMLPCAMNTYVVPLCCRGTRDPPSRYLRQHQRRVLFVCRTSNDEQYRRVRFEGKDFGYSDDWDIHKAMIKGILIPEDGRSLQLAPHDGLPRISIMSDLEPWRRQTRFEIGTNEPRFPLIEDEIYPGPVSAHDATIFLPLKTFSGGGSQIHVQFRRGDLEDGLVLGFTRPAPHHQKFRYTLNLGFDQDFRPIALLHTITYWPSLPRFEGDPWWSLVVSPFLAPFTTLCWRRDLFFAVSSTFKAFAWKPERFLDWAEVVPQSGPIYPLMPKYGGNLSLVLNGCLPRLYGCTKLTLLFRHSDGLNWDLFLFEGSQHPGIPCYGYLCRFRLLADVRRLYYIKIPLYALMFYYLSTPSSLVITFLGYFIFLMMIVIISPIIGGDFFRVHACGYSSGSLRRRSPRSERR
jgi:hypothetical protein